MNIQGPPGLDGAVGNPGDRGPQVQSTCKKRIWNCL